MSEKANKICTLRENNLDYAHMLDFFSQISRFSPAQIVEVVGCSSRAAYGWLNRSRCPAIYEQAMILEKLAGVDPWPAEKVEKRGRGRPKKYGA